MLKYEPAWEEGERGAIDLLRVDRHDGHLEEIPDRLKEPLFIHLAGIKHLRGPGAAVEVRGKFRGLVARRHSARHEQIDERITDRRIHALILLEPGRIVMRRSTFATFSVSIGAMKTLITSILLITITIASAGNFF